MGKFTQLTHALQFQRGLGTGLATAGIALILIATRKFGRRPAVAGIAAVAGGLITVNGWGPWPATLRLPDQISLGIALALVTGLVWDGFTKYKQRHAIGKIVTLIPSSLLIYAGLRTTTLHWAATAVAIAIPLCSVVAVDFEHFHRRTSLSPLLILICVAGIYTTTPDTEGARTLLGAALPLLIFVFPKPLASLGLGGTAAMFAMVWSVAAIEGAARPGSIVGALGCAGLLVVEPIARRLVPIQRARPIQRERGTPRRAPSQFQPAIDAARAGALQFAAVAWASRVAGFQHTALNALALLALGMIPTAMAALLLAQPARRNRQRQPTS